METQREALLVALETAALSLDKAVFNYVVFNKKTITCFNSLSVTIVPFESDIDVPVSASVIDFLRKAKGDAVKITRQEGGVEFRVGRSKAFMAGTTGFTIPTVPEIDDYGFEEEPDEADNVLASMANFREALLWCSTFTDKKSQSVRFSHVKIDADVCAMDNYRSAVMRGAGYFPDKRRLVSGEAVRALAKLGEIQNVIVSDAWLSFLDAHSTKHHIIMADGDYPDMQAAMDFKGEHLVFPDTMTEILDRLSVFLDDKNPSAQEALVAFARNGRGRIHREAAFGTFDEDFAGTKVAEPFEFLVNPLHLSDALNVSFEANYTPGKITFSDKMRTVLLSLG